MSRVSPDDVRRVMLSGLEPSLAAYGLTVATVPEDFDLRAHGVIDSLGFLELVTALEDHFAVELDIEALPPEDLTVVGPLSRLVARQASAVEDAA